VNVKNKMGGSFVDDVSLVVVVVVVVVGGGDGGGSIGSKRSRSKCRKRNKIKVWCKADLHKLW